MEAPIDSSATSTGALQQRTNSFVAIGLNGASVLSGDITTISSVV